MASAESQGNAGTLQIPMDFSTLKYSYHSFRSISGGLRKSDFPGGSICSPVKLARDQLEHQGHNSEELSRTNAIPEQMGASGRRGEANSNDIIASNEDHLGHLSSVVADDYISCNFKWATCKDTHAVVNICPRSFDVAGDCPVCKNNKKSKLNWRSIYEVNLSSSTPLIDEVKDDRALEDSLLASKALNVKSKQKMKTVAIDSLGRTGGTPTTTDQLSQTLPGTKALDGRQVSWQRPATAGSSRRDDEQLPSLMSTQLPERPHTSGGKIERTVSFSTNSPSGGGSKSVSRTNSNAAISRNSSNTRQSLTRQSSGASGASSTPGSSIKSKSRPQSSLAELEHVEAAFERMDTSVSEISATVSVVDATQTSSKAARPRSASDYGSSKSRGLDILPISKQPHVNPKAAKEQLHKQPSLQGIPVTNSADGSVAAPLLATKSKSFAFSSGRMPLVISSMRPILHGGDLKLSPLPQSGKPESFSPFGTPKVSPNSSPAKPMPVLDEDDARFN